MKLMWICFVLVFPNCPGIQNCDEGTESGPDFEPRCLVGTKIETLTDITIQNNTLKVFLSSRLDGYKHEHTGTMWEIEGIVFIEKKLRDVVRTSEVSLLSDHHFNSTFHCEIEIYYLPKIVKRVQIEQILLHIQTHQHNIIILSCSLIHTAMILEVATELRMNNKNYIWVIYHQSVLSSGVQLPQNLLLVEKKRDSHGNRNKIPHNGNTTSFNTSIKFFKGQKWETLVHYSNQNKVFYKQNFHQFSSMMGSTWNLKKRVFSVVTIEDPPFLMRFKNLDHVYDSNKKVCKKGKICWKASKSSNTTDWTVSCCYGYCIDLLSMLEKDIGLTTRLYMVEDSSYGHIRNKTWVGMVGDLVYGKADIILAALTINTQRLKYIDFTQPFLYGGLRLVTVAERKKIPFFNMETFNPLTPILWLTVFLTTIAASAAISQIEQYSLRRSMSSYSWKDSIVYTVGLLFQRDIGGKNPQSVGGRVTSIAMATGMIVMMSTYTAMLTANKVTTVDEDLISGFHDQKITNPTHDYRYGTLHNSAYTQMFSESDDPTWNRMSHFMKHYNFVDSNQAIDKLLIGDLNAIIQDYHVAAYYVSKESNCKLKFVGDIIKNAGYGLAAKKGSKLTERLSKHLQDYRENGFLIKLEDTWVKNSPCLSRKLEDTTSVSRLDIRYFASLFLLATVLTFISCFILFVEILFIKIFRERKHRFHTHYIYNNYET